MIRAGIVGASGYTAAELLRVLRYHPEVSIRWCFSHSTPNVRLNDLHDDLLDLDLSTRSEIDGEVDVVFLCLGHGHSGNWLRSHLPKLAAGVRIIDLSSEFRHGTSSDQDNQYQWLRAFDRSWIYGLPEAFAKTIREADAIANPGCFATALQLALLPLSANGLIQHAIHANAITGATGAGRGLSQTSHFSWRTANVSSSKVFEHQHLGEIGQTLASLLPDQHNSLPPIHFVPNRGPFSRGIFATVYTDLGGQAPDLQALFEAYYQQQPFTVVQEKDVQLKQVVNTNYAVVNPRLIHGQAVITVAIDNLLKGAVGQAIENMNLMFGFDQRAGLSLKANAW